MGIFDKFKSRRQPPPPPAAPAPSQPVLTDEIVYRDETHLVRKIWTWEANSLHEDGETGLLKVLLSGRAFNWGGKSVFATAAGTRLTDLTFDDIGNFREGLAWVAICGRGYGFVDPDMNPVIPMKYDEAKDFKNGWAKVRLGKRWLFVDKTGRERPAGPGRYQELGNYSDGMCRVSTLKLRYPDLAYHSDYEEIAGTWGYVNRAGVEVIPPQFIYATDFKDGIAIVAKGKWTRDPKWDNKCNQGCYWTDEELWGGIDKAGNEVIPFVFDAIGYFDDCTEIYMAHTGGWKDGHWGVIDRAGNWLAEPVFGAIKHEYRDGLFIFYGTDPEITFDEVPMGIYDLRQKKVLFEPQFFDICFLKDGDIKVEVFDPTLGRRIEKIIDRTGAERFKSVYTSIYTWADPYEVVICDEAGERHGLIDKQGSVIVPCVHAVPWGGFLREYGRICFEEDGKVGLKDYSGTVLVPPIYREIHGWNAPFLTVSIPYKDGKKVGLITADGRQVLPLEHGSINWCCDNRQFCFCSEGRCEMYRVESITP